MTSLRLRRIIHHTCNTVMFQQHACREHATSEVPQMEELIDSVLHHSVCMDSKKKLVGFMNVKRRREENDFGRVNESESGSIDFWAAYRARPGRQPLPRTTRMAQY